MTWTLIFTFIPIIIACILLIGLKIQAQVCALVAWIALFLIAVFLLDTPFTVSLKSTIHGFLTSFPFIFMVILSILQITLMEQVGAIKRVAVFLKTLAPYHRESQVMLLAISAGSTMNAIGAVPNSILPPIFKDMGWSKFDCIVLPCLGYAALCTYAMMSAPLIIVCDLTNTSLVIVAQAFSLYLPVISTVLCFGALALLGGLKSIKAGFIPALITGLSTGLISLAIAYIPALESAIILSGIIAGLVGVLCLMAYMKLTGQQIIDRSVLTAEDKEIEKSMSLLKALSPWLILISCLLSIAFIPPLNDLLKIKLECPVEVIAGNPVKLRPLWNAYFWILVSTIIAVFIFRPNSQQNHALLISWRKRFYKPAITVALFFGVGLLMTYTGYQVLHDGSWALITPELNMIHALSQASANAFGVLYPLVIPPLGLFAGFVTSSEASALAMFAGSNLQTANILGLNGLIFVAATGIAGGIASIISPAKLIQASATIDSIGCEADIIKKTFKVALVLTVAVIVLCFIFSQVVPA